MAEDEPIDPVLGALRDLLQSEGWRLLREQADREWGPAGLGRRMTEAIAQVGSGPDRAYELAQKVEQTYTTAQAINGLIAWPTEELKRRTPQPASRRAFANLRRSS